jgi:phosphoribosylanthranilate isomerase
MTLFIKICGLRTADDVAAAVASGADAIGFVFAESLRRVTPTAAARAAAGAPARIKRVAVMRHPEPALWQEVLDGFRPDVLQTDADDLEALDVPAATATWPVYREGRPVPPASIAGTWLYEGPASGAGNAVDWKLAAGYALRGRMILAGGLDAGNVARAIATVAPWGVDVSSGVESAPGVKDPDLISRFIRAARAAETTA